MVWRWASQVWAVLSSDAVRMRDQIAVENYPSACGDTLGREKGAQRSSPCAPLLRNARRA
jgi:hypothetical protein